MKYNYYLIRNQFAHFSQDRIWTQQTLISAFKMSFLTNSSSKTNTRASNKALRARKWLSFILKPVKKCLFLAFIQLKRQNLHLLRVLTVNIWSQTVILKFTRRPFASISQTTASVDMVMSASSLMVKERCAASALPSSKIWVLQLKTSKLGLLKLRSAKTSTEKVTALMESLVISDISFSPLKRSRDTTTLFIWKH